MPQKDSLSFMDLSKLIELETNHLLYLLETRNESNSSQNQERSSVLGLQA